MFVFPKFSAVVAAAAIAAVFSFFAFEVFAARLFCVLIRVWSNLNFCSLVELLCASARTRTRSRCFYTRPVSPVVSFVCCEINQ